MLFFKAFVSLPQIHCKLTLSDHQHWCLFLIFNLNHFTDCCTYEGTMGCQCLVQGHVASRNLKPHFTVCLCVFVCRTVGSLSLLLPSSLSLGPSVSLFLSLGAVKLPHRLLFAPVCLSVSVSVCDTVSHWMVYVTAEKTPSLHRKSDRMIFSSLLSSLWISCPSSILFTSHSFKSEISFQ